MLKLSRPLTLLFAALTYLLGAGISAYLGRDLNPAPFWLGLVFVIVSQLAMNWLGDVFRPHHEPLLDGDDPKQRESLRRNLLNLSMALLAVNAVLAFLLYLWHGMDLPAAVFLALSLMIALAAAVPPLRLANHGYGELAASIHLAYMIPSIGFLLQGSENHPLLVWLTMPLTLMALAYFLITNFMSFQTDQKYERATLLRLLTWERAVPLHHSLLLTAYLIFILMPWSGYPIIWQSFLTAPFALFQVIQLRQIALGGAPNWKLLHVTAIAVFGLTIYFLTITFWMR